MAKAPVVGRVKTRLCPPCDAAQAAAIAQAALEDTLQAALLCGHPVVLALDGPRGDWLPAGIEVIAQQGLSFNERLASAWLHLADGGVQVGMDTPQITPQLLDDAVRAVSDSGAAFGPATDGGWWLLGLARPEPTAFEAIAMSASDTGARQLERLRVLGYHPTILPTLTDIDTWATAVEVGALAAGSRTARAVDRVSLTITGAR